MHQKHPPAKVAVSVAARAAVKKGKNRKVMVKTAIKILFIIFGLLLKLYV